jgi:hypothetical protein
MINRNFENNFETPFDFFNDYNDTRRHLLRIKNNEAVKRLDERFVSWNGPTGLERSKKHLKMFVSYTKDVYIVAEKDDFSGENYIVHTPNESIENIAQAVTNAIGFHAKNILETLTNFKGYENVEYKSMMVFEPFERFKELEIEFQQRLDQQP